jgi:hypothetical protein
MRAAAPAKPATLEPRARVNGRGASTATRQAIPIVDLQGTPHERGRIHGEELRSLVATGVTQWKEALEQARGCPSDAYIAQFLAATSFDGAVRRWAPELLDEIRGVAEGAALPFETVYAYNLMDEEWWFGAEWSTRNSDPSRGSACSAVGLRTAWGGHPVVAQNMDLPNYYVPTQAILRVYRNRGAQGLILTAAGLIGLCGCNSSGLALCCNTLPDVSHSTEGLPVALLVRKILEQTSIREARAFVSTVPHASGQNLLLADPEDLCDLECSADQVAEFGARTTTIVHTNHSLANTDATGPARSVQESTARFEFLATNASAVKTEADLRALLGDRTVPLCKTPTTDSGRSVTFAALTVEASVPPSVHIASGPPDRTPWSRLSFSDAT